MDFSGVDEGHAQGENPTHFYYNHDERIKNAPPIVQEYYAGRGPRPVKGLFRVLVANKGNRFMLGSIFILAAFLWIYTFFINRTSVRLTLPTGERVSLEEKAFTYDERVFVMVGFPEAKKLLSGPAPIKLTIYLINSDGEEALKDEVSEVYSGAALSIKKQYNDYNIKKVNCHLLLADDIVDWTMTVTKP